MEDEEVSLVDGVLEGALGALGDEFGSLGDGFYDEEDEDETEWHALPPSLRGEDMLPICDDKDESRTYRMEDDWRVGLALHS
ncbi:hypothetical protein Tco_0019027 [Tanacetum coccineum]